MKISTTAIVALSLCAIGSVVNADEQTRQACTSDDDCSAGDTPPGGQAFGKYCSLVDNTCVAAGDCTAIEDCTDNFSNVFAIPMCIGTMYCIEDAGTPGKCVQICEGTPSTCDAFEACDDAGLEGECCPNADGKFLACCAGVTLAPTTVPENRPGEDALCSLYPSCLADGLTADVGGESVCCPDDEGDFLDCCNDGKGYPGDILVDGEPGPVTMPSDPATDSDSVVEGDDDTTPVTMPADPATDSVEGDDSTPVTMPADPATDSVEGDDTTPVTMPADPTTDSVEGDDTTPVTMPADPANDVVDPEFGVDPPVSCLVNTDCDFPRNEYCGQGTCIAQGNCVSDIDCFNPSNVIMNDKRCVGYLYCDISINKCDRECGFECPGDVPATNCTVTGCDTRIACPGSVNCVPDLCDDDCKGMYFDSSGTVLTECNGDQDDDEQTMDGQNDDGQQQEEEQGVSMVGEPLLITMPPTPADADQNDDGQEEEEEEQGVSMVGEPLVQTMPPTPADADVEPTDSSAESGTTSTATATTTATTADGTTATDTTTAATDASASVTVGVLSSGNSLSASVIFTILVVALTGLVVGTI